jgi:hypothetical protein
VTWTDNAQTFTTLAVDKADKFGQIEKDVPAVLALLEGMRPYVGYDVQEKMDEIIARCFRAELEASERATVPVLPAATNSAEPKHLLISYASADRVSSVDRLAKDLTERDYRIWVDNLGPQYGGITAGKEWQQELANALHQAALIVFVLTPDSLRSVWCRAELARAREQGTAVIPVLVRPLKAEDQALLSEIEIDGWNLSALQYRDFNTLGYDRGLTVLLEDIARHLM